MWLSFQYDLSALLLHVNFLNKYVYTKYTIKIRKHSYCLVYARPRNYIDYVILWLDLVCECDSNT